MSVIRQPTISRHRLAAALATAATAAALIGGPAAASGASGASAASAAQVGIPRQVPATFGGQASLAAISCKGPSWCMAVGTYVTTDSVRHALAMTWNGTAWRT